MFHLESAYSRIPRENKKEVKTASFSPPGVVGCCLTTLLAAQQACPARQVCGLTRDFCNSLGDSPPTSLSFSGL